MAEFIEIIILSAIQGISEFIPVSSSAHLYLMSEVQNFEIKSLLTDVSLHLGSLLAILFYFRDDFLKLFKILLVFFSQHFFMTFSSYSFGSLKK